MVVTLKKTTTGGFEVNKDDEQIPRNNISYANFWVYLDPSKPIPAEFRSALYTGEYVDNPLPSPGPPLNFDSDRPYNLPLHRFNQDGVLLLDPQVGYDFGRHVPRYERHRIITFAGQTGDVPHVAAALAADPLTDVLLLTNPDIPKQQVEDMLSTYKNAIRDAIYDSQLPYERLQNVDSRVQEAPCISSDDSKTTRKNLNPLTGDIGRPFGWDKKRTEFWTYTNAYGGRAEYVSVSVVGSTYIVAKAFRRMGATNFYAIMSNCLTSPESDLQQKAIMDWAANPAQTSVIARLLREPRQNVLVVWSRYSGQQKDGYNPAGDSDPKGQSQLLDIGDTFKPNPLLTVTIGHEAPKNPNKEKTQGTFHLGEFWKIPDTPFTNKKHPGQTSFYVALRAVHNVVQVGQKTGGMDNAALIGIPTVYIEDIGSPFQERMKKWVEVMTNRYCCALVVSPPTPLGKAIRWGKDPSANLGAGYINTDWYTIQYHVNHVWKTFDTSEAALPPIP